MNDLTRVAVGVCLTMTLACGGCATTTPEYKTGLGEGGGYAGAPECVSLLGRKLYPRHAGDDLPELEKKLAAAREKLAGNRDDVEAHIWVGRRLGYLWRMHDAIAAYTRAAERFPYEARVYRHRGHRFISMRQFDDAIEDLQRASALLAGQPDEVEPDGMPNEQGVPLTTTGFNVWYHLALAYYLEGRFESAVISWENALERSRDLPDNRVAVTDWMYLTLRRLGRDEEAAALLEPITADMEIIENHAYHRRLLMYKGLIEPDELLDVKRSDELEIATLGYGLGQYLVLEGRAEEGRKWFERVVRGPYWPAFGFIASEVELARAAQAE